MTIIKEILRCKTRMDMEQHRIVIRTNTYGSNFAHFQKLFDEAKKDFPHITPETADIKHYAGRRYKGTYGIEFNIDIEVPVPEGYKDISEVEFIL